MKVKEIKRILKLRQRKLPKLSIELGFLIRPLILISTSALVALIFYFGEELSEFSLREGDIALRDIYAPFDFQYKVGVNEEKTREAKERAKREAGEVYELKKTSAEEIINRLEEIVRLIGQREEGSPSLPERLVRYLPGGISFKELNRLKGYDMGKMLSLVSSILTDFYKNNYVIRDEDLRRLKENEAKYIYIRKDKDLIQLIPDSPHLITLTDARELVWTSILKNLDFRKGRLIADIVSYNIGPNLILSPKETEELKRRASENVVPIYTYKKVKKHERILSKGEKVKKEDLIKLKEITQRYGRRKLPYTLGVFFFTLTFLSLMTISFKYFDPKFYRDISKLVLLCLVLLLTVCLAKAIITSPLPSYIIPVAAGSMLIAILTSYQVAIKITILAALLCGMIIGDNIAPPICFLIGGLAGVIFVKDIRKRSQLLKAGILVGEVQFFTVVLLGLIFGMDVDTFIREALIGFFNGLISAFLVLGILPMAEHAFRITTNIRLLELSDLNHPLLRELLIKAPGTYHHSLMVSNLAEQAAEAIGANPLLARVGAYFHDIGKLEKPDYFSENQPKEKKERSKHDKLSPSMSSLIIINHVKKGIELAQKYKLPPAIIDFIEQHHGTSLVYYFYHKALEKMPEEEIKEEQFRYPGPKPQTKEVAIVSLADAVEAATRSLQEPTPARIKGLIKEIINNKFSTGELDECELTLKDLNTIADVFTMICVSIHHARIEYPIEKKQV